MFNWFKGRPHRATAERLYEQIVSQARQPEFYASFGVSDDVAGRFEMVCLHMFGVMERIGLAGATDTLGRELVEAFFRDMDDVMREMGVGDTTVPKKMRKTSEGLYGRLDAYGRGIRDDDRAALSAALARNIYADESRGDTMEARALAGYTRRMVAELTEESDEAVTVDARIAFPELGSDRVTDATDAVPGVAAQ
ncbi:MAG: ubiquinol-cytochrome C chaperone family protein [Pseudomonadota bacterium]